MAPDHKVAKQYIVTLAHPISDDYIEAFAKGMAEASPADL